MRALPGDFLGIWHNPTTHSSLTPHQWGHQCGGGPCCSVPGTLHRVCRSGCRPIKRKVCGVTACKCAGVAEETDLGLRPLAVGERGGCKGSFACAWTAWRHGRGCQWARRRDTVWLWLDADGTHPLACAGSYHEAQCMVHLHCVFICLSCAP